MKTAAIYNQSWESLGGGERYTAAVAKLLEDVGYEVQIWWPEDYRSQIFDRFGIELKNTQFVPFKPGHFSNYELVFWVSDGSIPLSMAKKTLLHFQIPFTRASLPDKLKARMYPAICNSYFTKSIIDPVYGIESQVIYPPVKIADFLPGKKENLIIAVGRLSKQLHAKHQEVLIEVMRQLVPQLPGWKLVLAGGSTDFDYYKELLDQAKGLPIKILPNPKFNQIQDLFAKAKVFWSATGFGEDPDLAPGKLEHFGITPVEAMAAGVVPVVTGLGGHRETIEDGKSGMLWLTSDDLFTKTLELAHNYRKWGIMSKKAEKRSTMFSDKIFVTSFSKFL
jgi:glycosyltransferase involved in cell wall biosynthesis